MASTENNNGDEPDRIGLVRTTVCVTVRGQIGCDYDDTVSTKKITNHNIEDMGHLGWVLGCCVCYEAKKIIDSIGFRERKALQGLISSLRSWCDDLEDEGLPE